MPPASLQTSIPCLGGAGGTYFAKIINVLARMQWGCSVGRDCPSLLGAALPWQAPSRGMGSLVTLSPFYRGERMRFVSEQKETSLFPPLDGAGRGFWRRGGCLCHAPSHLRRGAGRGWGTRGCPPAPRWLWVPSGMCSQLEPGSVIYRSASVWHHKGSQENCWHGPSKQPCSAAALERDRPGVLAWGGTVGWILPWVRRMQTGNTPRSPWGLASACHRWCESGMCPVMSFPAVAMQGIIVGSHPEPSAQFFLCSSSDNFYLSF